ncbi:MAG TPA: P22 phage major capsid protein family protein, partial [Stellaceae bacterium]|nr:P22 phage major capsid protein family protein [Stellaceae bacterium]
LVGTGGSTYFQDLGFTRDAFGLVTVPMELPDGNVDFKYRQDYKGMSIRIIRGFDIWNDVWPARVDCLYGVAAFYPETAVRLTN